MEFLSLTEFKSLSESASDRAVSIFLPTHTAGPDIQQDPIRLKNLLSEAEDRLLAAGVSEQAAAKCLKPAMRLIDNLGFWRYQSRGLALFLTEETCKIYRLPLDFESLVVVSNRFYLKPLLPLFFDNRYFYLLALSQNQVRLFQATRYQISEIPLGDMPGSLAEALRYDDPEKQLQYHSTGGGSQPVYHGQGGGTDDEKVNLRRFLNQVSDQLQDYLQGEEAPLVIASVEYLQPIFQEVSRYPNLMGEGVYGNYDDVEPDELREAAWPKVAALVEQSHQEALTQYQTLQATSADRVSDLVDHLVAAACRGQVDTLFVLAHAHYWGTYDAASGRVEPCSCQEPQAVDLLDLAAVQTFQQGGKVYLLESEAMPVTGAAAAIYRYEVPVQV